MQGPQERMYAWADVGDDAELDSPVYLEDGATFAIYGSGGDELARAEYDGPELTSVRGAVVDAVATDEDAARTVREALEGLDHVVVTVADDADAATDLSEHMNGYNRVDGVQTTGMSQEVMEHEYVDGMCDCCGSDLDILKADPETDDLDVYLYECGDCGNEGHYFGGEESEDGPVTVRAEFTGRDDLDREVDVRAGTEILVYDLDRAQDPEAFTDDGKIYSAQIGNDWKTRPDGLLYRLMDQPVGLEDDVRSTLESHMEDPNFGVVMHDVKGGADVERAGDDGYVKIVEEQQLTIGGAR